MQVEAVILGASGYGGGELLYWLSRHPHVASIRGTSRAAAGKSFASVHPNLRGVVDGSFESEIDWVALSTREQVVVFSSLPHGQLAQQIDALEESWARLKFRQPLILIDLSHDFRASTRFVYGMPEWNRAAIVRATRIASAGCFATALQLALLPLRDLEIGFIAATGVTGSSGSGKDLSETTHHPTRAHDFRAYKILSHQHVAEVEMAMRANRISGQLSFVPQSGPFVRGIFVTIQFELPSGFDHAALVRQTQEIFRDSPFVRLVEESPRLASVIGSNFADLHIAQANGTAAILVALDNLGKGMAGQAVQEMNIALELPEIAGLWQPAHYPA